eukprot:CAMPEP_0113514140 /NCGR_PEP_ID=MMETSP0014_2-20120614/40243_1 /TAXON_ID=2857 /ORGANISM="Nitzschia sp." /LENGTH=1036 /DNA_ID=CAMNT_0000410603 /DNA_START=553 /DNA_END=3660 /DNA_ORIENTATION=+ /assembly_acc=CAM_ASM_000159
MNPQNVTVNNIAGDDHDNDENENEHVGGGPPRPLLVSAALLPAGLEPPSAAVASTTTSTASAASARAPPVSGGGRGGGRDIPIPVAGAAALFPPPDSFQISIPSTAVDLDTTTGVVGPAGGGGAGAGAVREEDDIINAVIAQEELELQQQQQQQQRLHHQPQQQQQQQKQLPFGLSAEAASQWMMEAPGSSSSSPSSSFNYQQHQLQQQRGGTTESLDVTPIDDDDGLLMMIDLSSDANSNNYSNSISTKMTPQSNPRQLQLQQFQTPTNGNHRTEPAKDDNDEHDAEIQQMIQFHVNANGDGENIGLAGQRLFYDGDSLTTNEDTRQQEEEQEQEDYDATTATLHEEQRQVSQNTTPKRRQISLPPLISSLKRPLSLRSGDRTSTPHTQGSGRQSRQSSTAAAAGVLTSHLSPERTRTLSMAQQNHQLQFQQQQGLGQGQQRLLRQGQSQYTSNTLETYYYTYEVEDPKTELSRPVPPFVVVHNTGHAIVKIRPHGSSGNHPSTLNGATAAVGRGKKDGGKKKNRDRRQRRQMKRLKITRKNSPFETGNDGIMISKTGDIRQGDNDDRDGDNTDGGGGGDSFSKHFSDESSSDGGSSTTAAVCCWRRWRPICFLLAIGLLILAAITVSAGLVRSKELEDNQNNAQNNLSPPSNNENNDATNTQQGSSSTTDVIVLPPQTVQTSPPASAPDLTLPTGSDGDGDGEVLIPFEGTESPTADTIEEERTKSPSVTGILDPTLSPTMFQTVFETEGPTGVEVIPWDSYVLGLISTESPDSFVYFDDASSPQYQALKWMSIDLSRKGGISYNSAKTLQRWALSVVYYATGGPTEWTRDQDWLSSGNECLWYSTSSAPLDLCDSSGNLVSLHLASNNLVGSLPYEISLLTHLSEVVLDNNSLTGTLPSGLFELSFLEMLTFSKNRISGSIPSQLGKLVQLEAFDASGNLLTGSIPTQVSSLTSIEWMSLCSNSLTGSIPTQMGSLIELQSLNLGSNAMMTGEMPEEVCNLGDLQQGFARSMPPTLVVDCSIRCDCCNPCCGD